MGRNRRGTSCNIFVDPLPWDHLYDERHWQIYGLTQSSPRAIELINTAATVQAAWLEQLADRVKRLTDRLAATPGLLTVVDTHVLLHILPPVASWGWQANRSCLSPTTRA